MPAPGRRPRRPAAGGATTADQGPAESGRPPESTESSSPAESGSPATPPTRAAAGTPATGGDITGGLPVTLTRAQQAELRRRLRRRFH